MKEQTIKNIIAGIVIMAVLAIIVICSTACNVTRTVTTKAEYYQKGDTTVQIVTRTTESYDGKVDPSKIMTLTH